MDAMPGYAIKDMGAAGWTVISAGGWYVSGFESQQDAGGWVLHFMLETLKASARADERRRARERREEDLRQHRASVLLAIAPAGRVH